MHLFFDEFFGDFFSEFDLILLGLANKVFLCVNYRDVVTAPGCIDANLFKGPVTSVILELEVVC